jgi:hypothetical protein
MSSSRLQTLLAEISENLKSEKYTEEDIHDLVIFLEDFPLRKKLNNVILKYLFRGWLLENINGDRTGTQRD